MQRLLAEFEDSKTINGVEPFLSWHNSPPDGLAFGQYSTGRDHIAFTVTQDPTRGVVWYAWRYVPDTESSIEHLSEDIAVYDEVEARIAAEVWARKHYEPLKRKYKMTKALLAQKAVKKGEAIPILPWYRLFMLICLAVALIILGILITPLSAWRYVAVLIIVVVFLGAVTYVVIDKGINTLYDWVKKGKYIVKEVR